MKVRILISLCLVNALYACSIKSETASVKQVRESIHDSWNKTVRFNKTDSGTLIGLPFPYTVPCINNTFQEMYYWDTYFTNEGMIHDGRIDLAKNNVNNMLYLVEKYGKMPNGNRTYYTNRSQPPYLSMMVASIYKKTSDKVWLKKAYGTLLKEYFFWMTQRISPVGLNHYSSSADNKLIKEFIVTGSKRLGTDFTKKGLNKDQLTVLGRHLVAECESGWDFNPRFESRCESFCPIDLNSNLYLYEINFAYFTQELGVKDSSEIWLEKAAHRKKLLKNYCYNKTDNLYYDYDYVNNKQSTVISAAIFSLMYAKVVSEDDAKFLVKSLQKIEFEHGLSACEDKDYHYQYQWSFPNSWPPLQYLAVIGLNNYNYKSDANRIAKKYVTMVANTYKTTGHLWEKYNVRKGNTDVTNEYEMPSMMGWTAGVFVCLSDFLNEK